MSSNQELARLLDECNSKHIAAQNDALDAYEQLQDMKDDLDEQAAHVKHLEKEIEDHEEAFIELEESHSNEIEDMRDEQDMKESERASMVQQIKTHVKSMQKELDLKESQLNTCIGQNDETTEKLAAVIDKEAMDQKQLHKNNVKIEQLLREQEVAELESNQLKTDTQQLQTKVDHMHDTIAKIRAELKAKKTEYELTIKKNRELHREKDLTHEEKLGGLSGRVAIDQRLLHQAQVKMNHMHDEIAKIRKELQTKTGEYKEKDVAHEESIANIKKELSEAHAEQTAAAHKDHVNNIKEAVSQERAKWEAKYAKLQDEIDERGEARARKAKKDRSWWF